MAKEKTKLKKKVTELLLHPITLFVLSTVVSLIFYLISMESILPYYATSYTEQIIKSSKQHSRLTVLWDGHKISNLKVAKVAFWNSGKKYLEPENLSKADPLRIVPSGPVKILALDVLNSSRENLKFKLEIRKPLALNENPVVVSRNLGANLKDLVPVISTHNEVLIKIVDDEALEHWDGGIFEILYSADQDVTFKVAGRVKGVPGGIQKFPFEGGNDIKKFFHEINPRLWLYALWGALAVGAGILTVLYINTILGWFVIVPGVIFLIGLLVPQVLIFIFNQLAPTWIVF